MKKVIQNTVQEKTASQFLVTTCFLYFNCVMASKTDKFAYRYKTKNFNGCSFWCVSILSVCILLYFSYRKLFLCAKGSIYFNFNGKLVNNQNNTSHHSYIWYFPVLVSTHLNTNYLNFRIPNFKMSSVFWTATSVQISQMAFCAFFWVLYNYVWHCSSLRVGVNVLKHYISTWIQTCSTRFAVKAVIISSVCVALGLRLV